MKKILNEIQSGKFVRGGYLNVNLDNLILKRKEREFKIKKEIEVVGEKLRKMTMPWIGSNKLVNKNKN